MPLHIDAPAPGMIFDPADFRIRGWAWLDARQADLVAIEARAGDTLLGETTVDRFHERPDVNARLQLAAGTRAGFEFSARHPSAAPRQPFELRIVARLRDGTRTPSLFTRLLASPPPERHPFQMLCNCVASGARGLEIGAHTEPVAGLSPFYTDVVATYAGVAGRVDFLSDARALPLADDTLDYLCSSHVLEHLPDPIAALHEWHRVLRPGGLLYLVVPDRRFTFDEPRATTPVEHLLHDFEEGTTAADAARHVDEFVFQTNWSILSPQTPSAEVPQRQAAARAGYLRDLEQGRTIDIHYHTFTPDSLDGLLRAAGFLGGESPRFTCLSQAEQYPPGRGDGIGLLLGKTGEGASAKVETFLLAREPAGGAGSPSRPGAREQLGTGDNNGPSCPSRLGEPAPPPVPAPYLPLVCPVSLRPLRLEIGAEGGRVLMESYSSTRYNNIDGCPALLPPPGRAPVRAWSDPAWRAAQTATYGRTAPAAKPAILLGHVDEPAPADVIDPLCCFVRGWVWLGARQASIAAVEAWAGETLLGKTSALYDRPDVVSVHRLPPGSRTGFELFAHHPAALPGSEFRIEIRARLTDGTRTPVVADATAKPIPRDYRRNHFGILLDQHTTAVQRHDNIFAVGPSQTEGSGELAQLLRRYLGPPPCRVIDVGCGLGSYGRGLLADGYDWMGADVNAADCAELARLGLPHRQVDGRTLPFGDGEFDAALCLEVLEHIEDSRAFLSEIRRVAPRRLIVSVPNCELLGYLFDHLATPWHMLETTHTNFFTRWSLGALLREFYSDVELRFHTPYPLRTVEGTPLHYNLLAIATNGGAT